MSNMSRMDRHRQTEQDKQKSEESSKVTNGKKKQAITEKKTKKKRKKRKMIWLILLIILSVLIGGYFKGIAAAKIDKNNKQADVEQFMGEKSSDGSVNVLLLGSDSRGADQGRSDSIMIAHYDKTHKQPKLVSIMRDTYVGIPTQDGLEYNKINAAYSYGGPELVRQTIKQTFGVSIQYYAIVNFDSFPKIIDTLAPGGLKIDAEKELEVEGTVIKQGQQKMDGHQALQYARFRKDAEGDFGRVRRQQQVMTSLLKQGLNPLNAWRLPETVGKVQGYTQTDIPFSFYGKTGTSYLFSRHKPLEILTVPVKDSWNDGYYDHAGSVLEIDEAMNAQGIAAFFAK
ncbi:MAG: LCP family protein [Vagococcus sp.]